MVRGGDLVASHYTYLILLACLYTLLNPLTGVAPPPTPLQKKGVGGGDEV